MRKVFPYVLSGLMAAPFSQLALAQGVSTQQAGDQNEAAQSGERKQEQKATRKDSSSSAEGRTGPRTQQSRDHKETHQSGDRSAGGGSAARGASPALPQAPR